MSFLSRNRETANVAPIAPAPLRSSTPANDQVAAHFKTLSEVPRWKRVLSFTEGPLAGMKDADRGSMAVIEISTQAVLVVHANNDQALQLELVKGKLREAAFDVSVATAAEHVIAAIRSGAGDGHNGQRPHRATGASEFSLATSEWIEYAIANRATDIHIETRGNQGLVRFRVDGEIEDMKAAHGGVYPAGFVKSCMGSLFNNDQQTKSGSAALFDAEKFLFCMVPYEGEKNSLKLRFQSLKGNEGPKTVLRLLHVDHNIPTRTFKELGYADSHVELWEQAMQTPSGMVLIAGVTGSGKSTSQKSFIELNPNTPRSAVWTIEDPVEYPIRGAHQIHMQRDLSNPEDSARRYAETVAALMRADPDVVMLGEIRDRFSSNAAQQLAETGHMALGTVHAHLLSGIVPRLVNPEIGMSRDILTAPNMATLFAYQALVAKLCPVCADSTEQAAKADTRIGTIAADLASLNLDVSQLRWKHVGGCGHCSDRGTIDQTVVAEMLMPDEDWLKHIRASNDTMAVEVYRSTSNRLLKDPNMTGKTVFEHTLYKALTGMVDARQCSRFDTWPRFLAYQKKHRATH
jgi:type II secretory ATPase GspE/PulE/Tfp pilus assembly ATPase PilB-like protein